MGIFDSILGQVGQHADVGNLASKLGIPSELAEKAIAALGQSHAEPGDTIEGAAAKTGLDTGMLSQIVEQIGGEGALGQYAQQPAGQPGCRGRVQVARPRWRRQSAQRHCRYGGQLFGKLTPMRRRLARVRRAVRGHVSA